MQNERDRPEPGTGRLLERMLFFSDSVFAIVLTLLVLDLRMPPGVTDETLIQGIRDMEPAGCFRHYLWFGRDILDLPHLDLPSS
jgi:hypothetical protein